jgi:hypothetical protein
MFSSVATKNVAIGANEEFLCIIEGVQMGDVDVSDELGFDMSRKKNVFLIGDNSIHGNRDDVEKHMGLDYASFGSPLSNEKVDDYVSSSLLIVDTIFVL